MDEQIPALEVASEEAEVLELTPAEETPKEEGGDPLDKIENEVARAEAKKWRAIAKRIEKKEVTPATPVAEVKPAAQEFLTKADFYKVNERTAIKEVTKDPEVKANWSAIVPFFVSRRGKETSEDIMEDIQDAITIFNARNVKTAKDDSARDLTTTPVVKSGGGTNKAPTPAPSNFKLPAQPNTWYAKK